MKTPLGLIYRLAVILMLSLSACGSDPTPEQDPPADFSNCRYEKPEAIFYAGLPQIRDHQFKLAGKGSEESFTLSENINVRILQYGCDYRTQEFKFRLEEENVCHNPEDCTEQIAQLVDAFSRLGPEYHVFREWGRAIHEVAPQISYGRSFQLAEGFWIVIEHEEGRGNTTLMLTLSEKP